MWRLAFALALAGCGHGKSPPGGAIADAAGGPTACVADFQAAVNAFKPCTEPSDCVLVAHDDCCGRVMMAVSATNEMNFTAAETQFHGCFDCGGRGCDHPDKAEDNQTPLSSQRIVVACTPTHLCMSRVE